MIDLFLRGEEMKQPRASGLPRVYVEPCTLSETEMSESRRAEPPALDLEMRVKNHSEVELTLPAEAAIREAKRCLRCDLHFTQPDKSRLIPAVEGEHI